METPVAVVVTNTRASWKRILSCYGLGSQEVLRLLHFTLSKCSKSQNNDDSEHTKYISIPNLNRMAARSRLADGYLYFFSCESNLFVLEELVLQFVNIRCSTKSAGLTVEDVVKDEGKVISLVESILVPRLLHSTPRLIEPYHLSTGEYVHKQAFDLSQTIATARSSGAGVGEGAIQRAALESPAFVPTEEDVRGNGVSVRTQVESTSKVVDEANLDVAESESQPSSSAAVPVLELEHSIDTETLEHTTTQNDDELADEIESPSKMVEPIEDPFNLGAIQLQKEDMNVSATAQAPSNLLDLGDSSDRDWNSSVVGMKPNDLGSSKLDRSGPSNHHVAKDDFQDSDIFGLAPLNTYKAAQALNDFTVDSPLSVIKSVLNNENVQISGIGTTVVMKEEVVMMFATSCLKQALCKGSIGIKCNKAAIEKNARIKLSPFWLKQLDYLRVSSSSKLDGLVLDCGKTSKFCSLENVIKYSVRPRRYSFPARVFFQAIVSPSSVDFLVQVLLSPKVKSITSASCSVFIGLGHLASWQAKDSFPMAAFDSEQHGLIWNANFLDFAETKVFRATLSKAELIQTEDFSKLSQIHANVTLNLQHQPLVEQDCQMLKQVDVKIGALPAVSISTAER